MTSDALRQQLRSDRIEVRLQAIRRLAEHQPQSGLFPDIVARIADDDERVKFFALTTLVKSYQTQLHKHAEELAPMLIQALMDGYGPVVDRAIWALNITGKTALPRLLDMLNSADARKRKMAAVAIGDNHEARYHADAVLIALLALLHDPEEHVQHAAVCVLMDWSPLRNSAGKTLPDVDFAPIYVRLRPVIEKFSLHPDGSFHYWANCYKQLLERS